MSDVHRLRSGRACLGCRKRKSRCDGARPKCSYCAKRNFDCTYVASSRSEGYVAALEGRVRRLERESRRHTSSSISPPSSNGNLDGKDGPLVVLTDVTDEELEYESDGEWQVQPRLVHIVDHGMFVVCRQPSHQLQRLTAVCDL